MSEKQGKVQDQHQINNNAQKFGPAGIQAPIALTSLESLDLLLQRAEHAPDSLTPKDMSQLQRTIGNRAVGALCGRPRKATPTIQAKLTVGPVGDKYEHEADQVAKQVSRQIAQRQEPEEEALQMNPLASIWRQEEEEEEEMLQPKPVFTLQRQEEEEEMAQMQPVSTLQRQEEEEELQTKPALTLRRQEEEEDLMQAKSTAEGGPVASDVEDAIQGARGSGQPLADSIRSPMEEAFGADFGSVKVHTDAQSDALNQSLQARAFTTGQDVFFRHGEYNPGSDQGRELIAHELTHVVQQSGGQVSGNDNGTTVRQVGDAFEQEAETADRNANDLDQSLRLKSNVIIQRALSDEDAKKHVTDAHKEKKQTELLTAAGIAIPSGRIKSKEVMAQFISDDTKTLIECLNHYVSNWRDLENWGEVTSQLKKKMAEESAKVLKEKDEKLQEKEAKKAKPQKFVRGTLGSVEADKCTYVAQGHADMTARWVQVGEGLKTGAAGPCVVVGLAGKDRVALSHFDSDSNNKASNHISSLVALYKGATGPNAKSLGPPEQAFIYGGQSAFNELFLPLYKALEAEGITIVTSQPADAPGVKIEKTAVVRTEEGAVFGKW